MRCFVYEMKPWRGKAVIGAVCLLAGVSAQAAALYDGSLGTTPAAQGWAFGAAGPASETLANGAVSLDTSLVNGTQAGYSRILPPIDSTTGFALSFTAQLLSESHTGNGNRAGFSVILLDNAHRGVELGFWTDQVWAQAVGFTKAESAAFDTTVLNDYRLSLNAGIYSLTINGAATPLLSGVLRDYSAAGLVYSVDNFLFLGDDTTSAKASVRIASVSTVPLPPTWALMLGPFLAGIIKLRRSRPAHA